MLQGLQGILQRIGVLAVLLTVTDVASARGGMNHDEGGGLGLVIALTLSLLLTIYLVTRKFDEWEWGFGERWNRMCT